MKVIGITGASGSGKTTVCKYLSHKDNIKIIDADKIAKVLTTTESEYLNEIRKGFEKDNIFLENGQLNRPKLASLIYKNSDNLQKLNAITFKHLRPKILQEIKDNHNKEIIVIDAPLLFEANLEIYCDYVITFKVSEKLKLARICKRDNITEEVGKSRLKIQHNNEFYINKSDFVIINDENTKIEDLENQVNQILEKIV